MIPSVTARNLGVYFDTNLNMETHVKNNNQHTIFCTISDVSANILTKKV